MWMLARTRDGQSVGHRGHLHGAAAGRYRRGIGHKQSSLTGTVAAINSFITSGSVDFTTPLDSNTNATLTVDIDDKGNTGAGGAKTDSNPSPSL